MRVYVDERFKALGLSFSAPRTGDAGYDLFAVESVTVKAGERALISTGIHMEIPEGYVGLVKDRSSIAVAGLHTMAGVIDAAYRGEVRVLLLNTNATDYHIEAGQKIAQVVVLPAFVEAVQTVDSLEALSTTERGAGGFGSTGK